MGYKIVEALSPEGLQEEVDTFRAAGYHFVGGVAVTQQQDDFGDRVTMRRWHYQAMVCEDEAVISGLGKMVELEAMPLVDVEKVRELQAQLREVERLGQKVYDALNALWRSWRPATRMGANRAMDSWEQYVARKDR